MSDNLPVPAWLREPAVVEHALEELDVGGGPLLPRLSIRGGRFQVRTDDGLQPLLDERGHVATVIEVVIVAAKPGLVKRYYAQEYQPDADDVPPDCWSDDGKHPAPEVPNPVSESCIGCPKNAWGSGKGAAGTRAKACRDFKLLVVALADDLACTRFGAPLLLSVPPASLKALGTFTRRLAAAKVPYWAVVVELSFEPRAQFPQLVFTPRRPLTAAEAAQVMELRKREDVQVTLGMELEIVPIPAPAKTAPKAAPRAEPEVEVQPATAPEPAAKEVPAAEPEVEVQPAPKGRRAKAAKAAPAAEPEPAAKADGAEDEESFDLGSLFSNL